MKKRNVITVDLGARKPGRVMQVAFDGKNLDLQELHRFPNIPVRAGKTLYWDILRLWHEIQKGIDAAPRASTIGVDAWGNDFSLLDRDGNLLSNPVHYRDGRTEGMTQWVAARVSRRLLFERTGIQYMSVNGLYQIASLTRDASPLLDIAATFLTIPDLINYWLTGQRVCEFTIATTTQTYNPHLDTWDTESLRMLGIPTHIFPEVVRPGAEPGVYHDIPVIASACHDTASAVVAVPTITPNFAYISSGTWSLLGLEIDQPLINDAAFEVNITNEGGAYGTFRLLKNVMGLWLAHECQVTWQSRGQQYSYEDLVNHARTAEAFRSLIDPDHPSFLAPGDMPTRFRDFCQQTSQPMPETVGQVMRTVYESLALKYRFILDRMIALTGRSVEVLHVVGGGARNNLLCQMTADAIQRPVIAGPAEAAALGNAVVQLIALGDLGNVAQARAMLAETAVIARYEPIHSAAWEAPYQRFCSLMTTGGF